MQAPIVRITSDNSVALLDGQRVISPMSGLVNILLMPSPEIPLSSAGDSSSLTVAVPVHDKPIPTLPSRTAFYLALGAGIIAGSLTALSAVEFSRAGTDIDHYISNLSEEHAETICGVGIGAGGISLLLSSAYMIWNCVKSKQTQHQIDQEAEKHRSGSFKALQEEYLPASATSPH